MERIFRGKTFSQDEHFDDGEWVEGYYICFNGKEHRIYSGYAETDCGEYYPDWFNVRPETVGQYTGLTDKNGKRIFEGDIIRYTRTNMFAPSCSFHNQDLVSLHLVLWDSSVSAFVQRHYELNGKRILGKGSAVLYDERAKENIVEVIGNIHDNKELLEVK